MDNRKKNAIYSLVLLVVFVSVWWWRNSQRPTSLEPMKIEGNTMGTTYHITYFDEKSRNFKVAVDSLLVLVNKSINTYDPESEASRFNKGAKALRFELPYLLPPIKKAVEVSKASGGAFDPTVMPLVYAWGFGKAKDRPIPTKEKIDSLLAFVGVDKIQFNQDSVWKTDTRAQLDFGGIGQGYGADVITEFLKARGIKNMLVELGGEGMACGVNLKSGKAWELGILDPNSNRDSLFFKAYVKLKDKSFTTSGNYFNYRIIDGKKYSHTIDPKTGYQAERAILSSSVFAADATTADAWATAFMVMGHEKAIELLKQHPELDAFFIYTGADGKMETYVTPGIKELIELKE
ncbi:MAG: FAD:protein FMN transferase [Bacteroidota bacterium]|jgi:thiamine biosynthesis lipoprotein|nr:FAD:protein FMN transferase [Bacteroidota bacterium]MCZ8069457.1 FAD:protein FMN transferase [Cytophagales bacterium]